MIKKSPADAFDAVCEMIDDLHRQLVIEGEDDDNKVIACINAASEKLRRPKVIDGGRKN